MKKVLRAGSIVAVIGAVVGFASGLGGLWGGPVDGMVILGIEGFVCGAIYKARRLKSHERAE